MTENNPYGGLLAEAIGKLGVELVAAYRDELTEEWLEENRGKIDLLHIHLPWYHYAVDDLEESVARCSDFVACLAMAKSMGYKLVWTVHNLYPHESRNLKLDRIARLGLVQMADALIVHCDYARECVREHFHRTDGVFTIPHGHFVDGYPNTISRAAARQLLGLSDDQFVYAFF